MTEKTKNEAKKQEKKPKTNDNVIYIGRKPTMSYVLAVITQFSDGVKEVNIKARGRSISKAVDVAEIVKNKFLPDIKIKNIEIGTEEREVESGNKINVSTLSVVLAK
ncbi:MAG: DNA-binding protein Alba [Candidatus Aenigmatarchaeota archaeon]